MNLGKTIRTIRKTGKLDQYKFAEKVGISQTTLSLIETNKTNPHMSTLQRISDYVKIPIPLLYIWSVEEDDVPNENIERYDEIWPKIEELANYVFKSDNSASKPSTT